MHCEKNQRVKFLRKLPLLSLLLCGLLLPLALFPPCPSCSVVFVMDEIRETRGNDVPTYEEFFRRQEYGLYKRIVTYVGLWPRERSPFVITGVVSLSLFGTIAQIIRIGEEWGKDFSLVCELIPTALAAFGCIMKFSIPVLHPSAIEQLLVDMKNNTLEMSKLPQYQILVDYGKQGTKFTIYYVATIGTFATLYTLTAYFQPVLLDIVLPLNESREKKLLFLIELYVDEDEHYLPILLFEYVYYTVCVYELITSDVLLLLFVQHICGLYSIAGNYIKHLHILENRYVDEETEYLQNEYKLKSEWTNEEIRKMFRKLRYGIQMFQKTHMYCEGIISTYCAVYTTMVSLNVLLISFTGYQFVTSTDVSLKLRHGSFVVGQVFHLFVLCYPGQLILDYSENFYYDVCTSSWYLYTKEIRMVYRFLIMRSAVFCKFPVGKINVLGVELFLSIVQMSTSFMTLLLAVQ